MLERDYIEIKKYIIYGIVGIISASIIGIVSIFYTSIQTRAVDKERLNNVIKTQEILSNEIKGKADKERVNEIKFELESKINDRFNSINDKLDLMMQYTVPQKIIRARQIKENEAN